MKKKTFGRKFSLPRRKALGFIDLFFIGILALAIIGGFVEVSVWLFEMMYILGKGLLFPVLGFKIWHIFLPFSLCLAVKLNLDSVQAKGVAYARSRYG